MITKRTCSLLALALPAMMLAIACSDEEPAPSGKKPTIVADESAESEKAPAPTTSTSTSTQETSPADDPAPAPTPNESDAGNAGGENNGGGGIDPTDCALKQGQECLVCCIENNGGANNDLVNCVQNCVQ